MTLPLYLTRDFHPESAAPPRKSGCTESTVEAFRLSPASHGPVIAATNGSYAISYTRRDALSARDSSNESSGHSHGLPISEAPRMIGDWPVGCQAVYRIRQSSVGK